MPCSCWIKNINTLRRYELCVHCELLFASGSIKIYQYTSTVWIMCPLWVVVCFRFNQNIPIHFDGMNYVSIVSCCLLPVQSKYTNTLRRYELCVHCDLLFASGNYQNIPIHFDGMNYVSIVSCCLLPVQSKYTNTLRRYELCVHCELLFASGNYQNIPIHFDGMNYVSIVCCCCLLLVQSHLCVTHWHRQALLLSVMLITVICALHTTATWQF